MKCLYFSRNGLKEFLEKGNYKCLVIYLKGPFLVRSVPFLVIFNPTKGLYVSSSHLWDYLENETMMMTPRSDRTLASWNSLD